MTIITFSCCDNPSPQKETQIELFLTSKRDSTFFFNIKRVYVVGADTTKRNFMKEVYSVSRQYPYISLNLPVSYASDSTIYVFENKITPNDTLIIQYNRKLYYKEYKNCGYQQLLTESVKKHYSTLNKYKLEVSFSSFGKRIGLSGGNVESALKIKLTEK